MTRHNPDGTVLSRRAALAGVGDAALGLAGCLGDDPQGESNDAGNSNGNDPDGNTPNGDDDRLTVFATMPAVWDFVRQ